MGAQSFEQLDPKQKISLKVPARLRSHTLIAGNEDNLDDSDRLSSRTVLTHFTALYVPSICAVQRRQVVCISMVHVHD